MGYAPQLWQELAATRTRFLREASEIIAKFAAIFMIVYEEKQNYIGIVEHIHDAHVKYIAS